MQALRSIILVFLFLYICLSTSNFWFVGEALDYNVIFITNNIPILDIDFYNRTGMMFCFKARVPPGFYNVTINIPNNITVLSSRESVSKNLSIVNICVPNNTLTEASPSFTIIISNSLNKTKSILLIKYSLNKKISKTSANQSTNKTNRNQSTQAPKTNNTSRFYPLEEKRVTEHPKRTLLIRGISLALIVASIPLMVAENERDRKSNNGST